MILFIAKAWLTLLGVGFISVIIYFFVIAPVFRAVCIGLALMLFTVFCIGTVA